MLTVMVPGCLMNASLRHKVIADNVANVNTPGFKRSEVPFEEVLHETLAKQTQKLPLSLTHERHLAQPIQSTMQTSQVRQISDNSSRSDGNNVDIETEMATMAKNTIYYDASVQQLSRYFSSLKSAINEGRR